MKYFDILRSTELFSNLEIDCSTCLFDCVGATQKSFEKGDPIIFSGEKVNQLGILLDGQLHILQDDQDGNTLLVGYLRPKDLVNAALSCSDHKKSPVTAYAKTDAQVLFLDSSSIFKTCDNSCPYKPQLIKNMLTYVANKNVSLHKRLGIVSIKSIRKKILRYLSALAKKQKTKDTIIVPYNRQEMADFLCVDRSALSSELAKMKKDGLIDYKKNSFRIIKGL